MNLVLNKVDYIALVPGYTSHLLYQENTYEKVDDAELLAKVQSRYSGHEIFRVTTEPTVELKFWTWGIWQEGDGCSPKRALGSTYIDPDIDENEALAVPIMIHSSAIDGIVAIDEKKTKDIIDTFYDYDRKKLNLDGSIIFAAPDNPDGSHNYLDLVEWLDIARSINVDFCYRYSPGYPSYMDIILTKGKSMLVVGYDCD